MTILKRFAVFACLLLCVVLLPVLSSCGSVTLTDSYTYAMDTVVTLRLPENTPSSVRSGCNELLAELESVFSRTDENSETAAVARAGETCEVSEEYAGVLSLALEVAGKTAGAFDPTLAPLSELWNITSESPSVPDKDAIADALEDTGYEKVTLSGSTISKSDPSVALDLGGCVKGYACEKTVSYLLENGVTTGLVSLGGNIGIIGAKPDGTTWEIGIADPDSPDTSAGYLSVAHGFVSVSGDYQRYFIEDAVRYHHILDPETGYPADSGVRSVAVWSDNGELADALSTALFVMGEEQALEFYESSGYDFEAVFYLSDGRTVVTPGIGDSYRHGTASAFSAPE